ncbi:MAG: acyl-[acyl-carrier-protein] thioesterase [Acidimicrobiales bacterium]
MTDDPLDIDPPASGRTFGHRRRVHLADGSPHGRARLDALARMLQDVSDEDTTDAGFPRDEPWVVRRVDMGVHSFPTFRDVVTATTWCSGIGGRWAERRVRVEGDIGGLVDAAVLWVHLDAAGRPARLPDRFDGLYAEAARGRRVRARLQHDARPADADGDPFPLRFTDFDLMGHVNNAVSWEPVEEALATRPELRAPLRVSVEHPASIEPGDAPEVTVVDRLDGFDLWITSGDRTCSSARVRRWAM